PRRAALWPPDAVAGTEREHHAAPARDPALLRVRGPRSRDLGDERPRARGPRRLAAAGNDHARADRRRPLRRRRRLPLARPGVRPTARAGGGRRVRPELAALGQALDLDAGHERRRPALAPAVLAS